MSASDSLKWLQPPVFMRSKCQHGPNLITKFIDPLVSGQFKKRLASPIYYRLMISNLIFMNGFNEIEQVYLFLTSFDYPARQRPRREDSIVRSC